MPELRGDFDVVVHSGDFLPNRTFGIRQVEYTFQRYWVEENASKLRAWLGVKPFLLCPGNHDYVNPVPILREVGVDAHWLEDRHLELGGVSFYGFPWVPAFADWNYEAGPVEMGRRLEPLRELLNQGAVDVVVAHSPMFGVLDRNANGTRCGSPELRKCIKDARHPPKLYLHGHIHEGVGVLGWSPKTIVSNAACSQNILTLAAS